MIRRDAALIALGFAMWIAALGLWRLAPGFDSHWLGMIVATRGSGVARIALGLTLLGEYPVLLGITALAAAWLVVRNDAGAAIWLLAVTLVGRAATGFEKDIFGRARPPLAGRLVEASSASFPSAHAFNTMLVGLAIASTLRGGRGAIAFAVVVSLAVGSSRLVLGVHWPSDVVAGWGSALAWALLWRPLLPLRRSAANR